MASKKNKELRVKVTAAFEKRPNVYLSRSTMCNQKKLMYAVAMPKCLHSRELFGHLPPGMKMIVNFKSEVSGLCTKMIWFL